jgi:hypothetical protein
MTNNKQQTAVEWLVEQFKEYDFADVKDTENYIIKMQSFVLTEKLEKAKEMDKQQKKECWDVAHQAGRFEGKGIAEKNWQTFEQYYNETYGGGDK